MSDDPIGFQVGLEWLQGTCLVLPDVDYVTALADEYYEDNVNDLAHVQLNTIVRGIIYKEDYILDSKTKLFLSHKGVDKPMVLRFFGGLKELGYDPWLDDDAMPAGTELHRGIHKGFEDSCAAVFFITPQFKDERYLQQEINYAIEQKTAKGSRFAIVTLVFRDSSGEIGTVPPLLKSYVWKEPATELDGFREIIRALPIKLGVPTWKDGI